jgi:hypothetical protein
MSVKFGDDPVTLKLKCDAGDIDYFRQSEDQGSILLNFPGNVFPQILDKIISTNHSY